MTAAAKTMADNRAQDIRTIRIARNDLLTPFIQDMHGLQRELAELSQQEAELTAGMTDFDMPALEVFFRRQADFTALKAGKQDELNRKRAGAEAFYKFIVQRLAERNDDGMPSLDLTPEQLYRDVVEGVTLHNDRLVIA